MRQIVTGIFIDLLVLFNGYVSGYQAKTNIIFKQKAKKQSEILTVLTFNLKYSSNLPFKVSNVSGTLSDIDCILQDLLPSKMSMSQQKDQKQNYFTPFKWLSDKNRKTMQIIWDLPFKTSANFHKF